MTITTGPNLGIAVNGAEGDHYYTQAMEQWRWLDALIQPRAMSRNLASPPGSPADGDVYIVKTSASGAWIGWTNRLVRYSSVLTAWESRVPKEGWTVWVLDEDCAYTFDGTKWVRAVNPMRMGVNNQSGTDYEFDLLDANGVVVRFTSDSNVGATLHPLSEVAWIPGSVISLRQVGDGIVTVEEGDGVTINIPEGYEAKTAGKGAVLMLHNVAADEWDLTGAMRVVEE